MSAVLVQSNTSSDGTSLSTTPNDLAFTSPVTNGNAVIVAVVSAADAAAPIYAASDATNGAYSSIVQNNLPGFQRNSGILAKLNVTGGFTIVSVTASTTANGTFAIFEVSGLSADAAQTGSKDQDVDNLIVDCSSVALSGSGFAVGAAMITSGQTPSMESGYTFANVVPTVRCLEYQAGTITNSKATMTMAAAQAYAACMALFPETTVRQFLLVR